MAQPLASVSASQSFQNLLDTVVRSIPKILVFLAVLVIGWMIARVLARVVDMILRRAHFDRFAGRGVVGQALERSHTDATSLIAKIVYYALLLITLQMAFGVFGPNPISTMINGIVAWLPRAIVAIIIIVIASAIAKVVRDLIVAAIGGLSYGPLLANIASIIIIALGAIAALNQAGIAAGVTQPVLYTVLLTAGAVVAIGVGGGLIRPMQDRWERMLNAAERETSAQYAAYQQGRTDAMRGAPPPERRPPQPSVSQPATRGGPPPGGNAPPEGGEEPNRPYLKAQALCLDQQAADGGQPERLPVERGRLVLGEVTVPAGRVAGGEELVQLAVRGPPAPADRGLGEPPGVAEQGGGGDRPAAGGQCFPDLGGVLVNARPGASRVGGPRQADLSGLAG